MLVKELISILQKEDGDKKIAIRYGESGGYPTYYTFIDNVNHDKQKVILKIEFLDVKYV